MQNYNLTDHPVILFAKIDNSTKQNAVSKISKIFG